MKYHFSIFLLSVFTQFQLCSCSEVKNDLTEAHLKGKVKSTIEYSYNAVEKFGRVENDKLTSKVIQNYNNKGNLETVKTYSPKSISYREDSFMYNSNNQLIEMTSRTLGDTNQMLKGFSEALALKFTFIYDKDGNEVEKNKYNFSDNSLLRKYISKYDKNGKIIEYNTYSADGKLEEKDTYDKNKKIIDKREYSSDTTFGLGDTEERTEYKYNKSGNLIETNKYFQESLTERL